MSGRWGEFQRTIDSSFTRYDSSWEPGNPDIIIYCTGTSTDKRANIHFQLDFNRHPVRNIPYFTTATNGALFSFDTCSDNILTASANLSEIRFTLDSVSTNSLHAHFEGTTTCIKQNGTSVHPITNGKFATGFRGGNHDPNSFRYTFSSLNPTGYDPGLVLGYFNEARMISNSLVLNGTPIGWGQLDKFRLIIRTGGVIQPGVYHSENGHAGLQLWVPSIYRNYVNDSSGSLTVTINNVTDNVVYGSFSGTCQGWAIASGSFATRIKNYVPEPDSSNRWAFGEDESIFLYRTFAGNVTKGSLSQSSGRYLLTINGASDHGNSVFKLVLSSNAPLIKGLYSSDYENMSPLGNSVDSLYFISPEKIWNGNNTYLYASTFAPALVQIDSIDAYHVEGKLMGVINIFLSEAGFTSSNIKEGKFSASF